MSQAAIVTISIGESYRPLSDVTHPSIEAYAKKLSADFIVLRERAFPDTPIGYEKLQLMELFQNYKRIVYFDSDLIVRSDTPNLFDIVPEWCFGAFNEAYIWENIESSWWTAEKIFQLHCPKLQLPVPKHDGRYFNMGVFVASREHEWMFAPPPVFADCFLDQTYLNVMLCSLKIRGNELSQNFNRLVRWNRGDPLDSYVIHYQGHGVGKTPQAVADAAARDLAGWKARGL